MTQSPRRTFLLLSALIAAHAQGQTISLQGSNLGAIPDGAGTGPNNDGGAGDVRFCVNSAAAARVSNTDSSAGNLFTAGARSFSIRDANGVLVYDSGEILDREAIAAGIYDDGRSRDKGVEPEGVELMEISGRLFAFIGLERTLQAAIAAFDITDPANTTFVGLMISNGDRAPEGLKGFALDGQYYLAFSNEGSSTTSVFWLAQLPEPRSLALTGLALVGLMGARLRRACTVP